MRQPPARAFGDRRAASAGVAGGGLKEEEAKSPLPSPLPPGAGEGAWRSPSPGCGRTWMKRELYEELRMQLGVRPVPVPFPRAPPAGMWGSANPLGSLSSAPLGAFAYDVLDREPLRDMSIVRLRPFELGRVLPRVRHPVGAGTAPRSDGPERACSAACAAVAGGRRGGVGWGRLGVLRHVGAGPG